MKARILAPCLVLGLLLSLPSMAQAKSPAPKCTPLEAEVGSALDCGDVVYGFFGDDLPDGIVPEEPPSSPDCDDPLPPECDIQDAPAPPSDSTDILILVGRAWIR